MNRKTINRILYRPFYSFLNKTAVVILCLFIGWDATSQDTVSLHLHEALQYALEANQQAQKSKLDIRRSEAQINEAKSAALPQLSGTTALNYNPILQKSALPGEIVGMPGETLLVAFGQKWDAYAGLSLNQVIFDNSVFTGLKAARTTRELYRLNAELTDEQIIEEVAKVYYGVLVQRQQLTALEATIKNVNSSLEILEGLYENGLAKKIDVDRLSVNQTNLIAQQTQLVNAVELLQNQLKFYIGMPIPTPIHIPEIDLSDIHPSAVTQSDFNASQRVEMAILGTQEELLKYQKEVYRGMNLPSLILNGNYSYQGIGNRFPIFRGSEQDANWFGAATIGLAVQIPIFNGFATRSKVEQADIDIRKLEQDINQTQLALHLEFENAKTQISNSLITLEAQKKNQELAEQVYYDTQNNYSNGLATLTDLLQSETSLTEAQNNYSKALLDYKIAEIQLIKSKGELKTLLNQ